MLIWRLLRREWRGGQLALIGVAVTLSVSIVSGVALLADRVEKGLVREMGSFLAADLAIESGIEIPEIYRERAVQDNLQVAETVEFESMVFSDKTNHLASIKAVSSAYPLRGQLTLTTEAFATNDQARHTVRSAPEQGTVWADERLLPLLDVQLGDDIEVGDLRLRLTKILLQEPDRSTGFSLIGARVMMSIDDLAESGLIQPGSRLDYRLLLAGAEDQVQAYQTWAEENLTVHERLLHPERVEQRVASAVDRGSSYLLLAGSVGLLLAGIAQALASYRYAQRHINEVALMKSWGASRQLVRRLLLGQLLLLGFISTVIGLILGWGLHQILLNTVREFLPLELPAPGLAPYLIASASGMLCLLGFTLPSLWHLPNITPLRVLRRDLDARPLSAAKRALWGGATLLLLLVFYARDLELVMGFVAGVVAVILILALFAYLFLYRLGRSFGHWYGSYWRLAIANLLRRPNQTSLQLVACSAGIMLLLVMVMMRTSLHNEWQMTIPEGSPNHFFVNVAPHQLDDVRARISSRNLDNSNWYPMVRGRIVLLNGEALRDEEGTDDLGRELNLTWSADIPESNEVIAGQWWQSDVLEKPLVSVEEGFANEIGTVVGDHLTFSMGGLDLEAEVTSIRRLDWDSMNPNFFMIFNPGTLDTYSPNWITSLNIPPEDRMLVSDILKANPTILVISLEDVISRIRTVITQATRGLELIFLLVVICGLLVFFAAIAASFDERAQEAAVLRTLGSGKRLILSSVAAEFATLGAIAGLVAALAADICIMVMQFWVFELPITPHFWIWLTAPLGGAVLTGSLGTLRTRTLVNTPPMQSLRRLLD